MIQMSLHCRKVCTECGKNSKSRSLVVQTSLVPKSSTISNSDLMSSTPVNSSNHIAVRQFFEQNSVDDDGLPHNVTIDIENINSQDMTDVAKKRYVQQL